MSSARELLLAGYAQAPEEKQPPQTPAAVSANPPQQHNAEPTNPYILLVQGFRELEEKNNNSKG